MKSRRRWTTLVKFLAVGLPAFGLAVPANYALVELAGAPKPLAYALVLVMQVSINYFLCKYFVFSSAAKTRWGKEFAAFVGGILLIRGLDWMFYLLLVQVLHVYYLVAQLVNVGLFALLKFLYSERIFSGDKPS